MTKELEKNRHSSTWPLLLIEGCLGVVAGGIALAWPGITALAILYILAAWAIFTGIAETAIVYSLGRTPGREWLLGLAGLASIALGILIGIQPATALDAVAWLIGAYAIVYGVLLTLRFFQGIISRSLAAGDS